MKNPENTCLSCMSPLPAPGARCPRCGKSNAEVVNSAHQLPAGSILAGAYLIGGVLGQGGFGVTYVGWDLNLDQKVAIKEFYPEGCVTRELTQHSTVLPLTGDKGEFFAHGRQKFVEEARVLARFNGDPCIVGVRNFFNENGTSYIVMDFVEGQTLKKYAFFRGGKLGGQETLRLLAPIVQSLSRVHDAGLLHRDIAPDNIILQPDGTVKLLDFGAARAISAEGEHSNTINVKHGFAPEEQYRTHGQQGPWSDVYALSATIYQLITGVTPPQALDRILSGDSLVPPSRYGADLTPQQETALMRGLAVKANDRTQNMRQFYAELFSTPQQRQPGYAPQPPVRPLVQQPAQQQATQQRPAQQQPAAGNAAPVKKNYKRAAIIGGVGGGVMLVALIVVALIAAGGGKKAQPASVQAAAKAPVITEAPEDTEAPETADVGAAAAATPAPETLVATQAPIVTPSPDPTDYESVTAGSFKLRCFGNGECEIAAYLGHDTELAIPAQVAGYTVTGLGYDLFYENEEITKVTLPEGLRYIADSAFDSCANLTELTLPESLESIGSFAFSCCGRLRSLTIPKNVHYIAESAFDDCFALTLDMSPENHCYDVESNILFSYDHTLLHTYLCGRSGVSYTIPETVTTLGDGAFDSCNNLSSIIIPETVTSIGSQAFFNCAGLGNINIPQSVTFIGELAFAMTNVKIFVDADNAFFRVEDEVLYSYDMTVLHSYPNYLARESFTVPTGVTRIENGAFYNAESLTSITLPEGLEVIGNFGFAYCGKLTSIILPKGLTTISNSAFRGCYALKSIVIPESVTYIGSYAFYNADGVTITGAAGSAAETYARENSIPFKIG